MKHPSVIGLALTATGLLLVSGAPPADRPAPGDVILTNRAGDKFKFTQPRFVYSYSAPVQGRSGPYIIITGRDARFQKEDPDLRILDASGKPSVIRTADIKEIRWYSERAVESGISKLKPTGLEIVTRSGATHSFTPQGYDRIMVKADPALFTEDTRLHKIHICLKGTPAPGTPEPLWPDLMTVGQNFNADNRGVETMNESTPVRIEFF